MTGWTSFFSLSADPLPYPPEPPRKVMRKQRIMNCQRQQQNANLFIAFSLEMVKLFAILIHGDESDYAVNGPRNKKMRFPSR